MRNEFYAPRSAIIASHSIVRSRLCRSNKRIAFLFSFYCHSLPSSFIRQFHNKFSGGYHFLCKNVTKLALGSARLGFCWRRVRKCLLLHHQKKNLRSLRSCDMVENRTVGREQECAREQNESENGIHHLAMNAFMDLYEDDVNPRSLFFAAPRKMKTFALSSASAGLLDGRKIRQSSCHSFSFRSMNVRERVTLSLSHHSSPRDFGCLFTLFRSFRALSRARAEPQPPPHDLQFLMCSRCAVDVLRYRLDVGSTSTNFPFVGLGLKKAFIVGSDVTLAALWVLLPVCLRLVRLVCAFLEPPLAHVLVCAFI